MLLLLQTCFALLHYLIFSISCCPPYLRSRSFVEFSLIGVRIGERFGIWMEQRKRRILVAVDESSESMEALRWGLKNLFHPSLDDLLILLHIQSHSRVLTAPGSPIAGFDITPDVLQAVGQRQDEASKTVLSQAKQICCEYKVASETMVAHGDPREAICEAVKRLQVDFLVMGSHGYGAFKRAYLGSVSDYCAHNAKCPVVIVKKQ